MVSAKPRIFAAALCVLIAVQTAAGSGVPDNKGTEFVLVFIQQHKALLTNGRNSLYVTSDEATNVTIEIPSIGFHENYEIEKRELISLDFDGSIRFHNGTELAHKGISIRSSNEISVYGLNSIKYTTDGFLGLPMDIQAYEYVVPCYTPQGNALVAVVANENDTNIAIKIKTPNGTVTFNNKMYGDGDWLNVTLNRLDAFQLAHFEDLTGTRIYTDKPLSVFSGGDCSYIPPGIKFCDHLVEQIPPINSWGRQFVTIPLETRLSGDIFRVLAAHDDTIVHFGPNLNETLQEGEFLEVDVPSTVYRYVTCSNPCLLLQYSKGGNVDNNTDSDPFMQIIPPIEQYSAEYTLSTPDGTTSTKFRSYIGIVIETKYRNGLRLDGRPLTFGPGGTWTQVAGTNHSAKSVRINPGTHTIEHQDPRVVFAVYLYGFMKDESYGYPGGLRLANIADECIPKIGLPADGMDNDCDYRIDEELANGLDDDGDGVIDEDLAAAPPRLIIPGDYSDQVCIINTTPDETGRARGTVAHKCQQRGVTSITYTDTGLSSTACEKRLVRKWELRDGCGHIVNGNQTIEQHIKEPVIRFPLDIDVYIKCDEYRSDWENNEVPQVLEKCPYHNITFHRDTTAGVCDGERTMVRHVNWTATDQCGKRQHHLQTININPQASNQIMDVQCNSVQLEVQVDVAKLNAQYENIDMTSLRLLDRGCTPFRSGSKLIFNIPLGACGTQRKETDNAIMYSNRIQSVSSSSERHRPPSSIISRGRALMLPFDCVLHKHATVAREFQRKGHNVIGRVHVVHGNFTIHMNMFKDKNYRIPIVQFPYFVAFGDTVFWSVKLATSDPNLKLIVQMCEATPFPSRTYPTKYFLVKDRCPTDPTLHIQSASPKEVKLDFEVFEFIRKIGLVYVYCDVTICTSEDTSPHCSQECSSTSGAPPTEGSTGHQLKRREANHKHTALNHYDLYTGPLVYREKTSKVDPQSSSKLTVAASKPENGLEIPWPAVILVAIALVALLVAVALLLFVSKKK